MEPITDVFEGLPENDRNMRFVNKSIGIGEEIIAAMARKGMSQRDLARALDINETLVSRWLGGMHNFTLRTLSAIEEVLDTDLVLTAEQVAEKITHLHSVVVKLPRAQADFAVVSQKGWSVFGETKQTVRHSTTINRRTTKRHEYSDV